VHNDGPELSFGNVLIVLIGLAVAWWMARAPRSFLKLMSKRFPGLDKDRPWLNWIVRLWGRFTFFSLLSALMMIWTPESYDHNLGVRLFSLFFAVAFSVLALKTPKKKEEDSYTALLPPRV